MTARIRNQEEEQCKRGKHYFIGSSAFCDRCLVDFDEWLAEERNKVAFQLVQEDYNRMLVKMEQEGKLDSKIGIEIYQKMRELARARGFLKLPGE